MHHAERESQGEGSRGCRRIVGETGDRRAAAIYTLIETAKLNGTDPQAWLDDVLARLQDHPARRIAELLPWNWKMELRLKAAA